MEMKNKLQQINKKYELLADTSYREGNQEGPLAGTPFFAKDAICVKNIESTAGSQILEGYKPKQTATAVQKLFEHGADLHGKTHQDEFGFGTFCTNCSQAQPKNPIDRERVTGGSSGGAAAICKALDKNVVSLGESTGGSITNPAAYNGVYGLTPTYGRVSRAGLISYSNSLDKIGVLSESLELVRKGYRAISGSDSRDQTSREFDDNTEGKNHKLAIPSQLMETDIQTGVRQNFQDSAKSFESEGYQVEEVDIPMLDPDFCVPSYYIIAMSEASTNLAKYCGMRYGKESNPRGKKFDEYFSQIRSEHFSKESKRRVLLGTFSRMSGYRNDYYVKAAKARNRLINEVKSVLEEYDALISPSMPNIAPKIDEAKNMPPEEVYAMDAMTVGPNLGGFPMLSVPNGKHENMPTGLHIVGDHAQESKILEVAEDLER